MLDRLEHFPEAGESVEIDGHRITVTEMDGRRITALEIDVAEPPPGVADDDHDLQDGDR